ncbi:MAG: inosine/xanthosine triphosphatase [Thermoprotei archaeon]|nr:MAG: inosine/xanthosine triphosphatase [Thermoprotei archaeon]
MVAILLRIVVGSKNPAKVEGVRRAFSLLGPAVVESVEVETSVGPQPMSLRETIKGAVERAVNAMRRGFNYSVGVEAGLYKFPPALTGYMEVQVAALLDEGGGITLGMSPSFEFPQRVVKALEEGEAPEAEVVIEDITGVRRIGEKGGAISFLTRGRLDRVALTELAVLMALVPRLNPGLYPPPRRCGAIMQLLSKLTL